MSTARAAGAMWMAARASAGLGLLELSEGRYAEAAAHCERAVASSRQVGDRAELAWGLSALARAALRLGDAARAADLAAQALAEATALGSRLDLAVGIAGFAWIALELGKEELAARLFGAAEQIALRIGVSWAVALRSVLNTEIARAKELLGIHEAAWDAGRSLDVDEALELASLVPTSRLTESDKARS
jgi:tetratricopeptide (TPR) repeat protein